MSCAPPPVLNTDCILADPCYVATQGLLDCEIGIVTQGFIIQEDSTPVVPKPAVPPNNIGTSVGAARKEWYVRKDHTDAWFGPLSWRDADKHARVMTRKGTPADVKYAHVGYVKNNSGVDVLVEPEKVRMDGVYANGKQFLKGRQAEFHRKKYLNN